MRLRNEGLDKFSNVGEFSVSTCNVVFEAKVLARKGNEKIKRRTETV